MDHPTKSSLKSVVANRVARVQQVSNIQQLRYTSTKGNPANISTQGMKIDEHSASTLWWNDPSLLIESPTWPMRITEAPSDVAKKREVHDFDYIYSSLFEAR